MSKRRVGEPSAHVRDLLTAVEVADTYDVPTTVVDTNAHMLKKYKQLVGTWRILLLVG